MDRYYQTSWIPYIAMLHLCWELLFIIDSPFLCAQSCLVFRVIVYCDSPFLSVPILGVGHEDWGGAADGYLQHPPRGPPEAAGGGTQRQGSHGGIPTDLVCFVMYFTLFSNVTYTHDLFLWSHYFSVPFIIVFFLGMHPIIVYSSLQYVLFSFYLLTFIFSSQFFVMLSMLI